MGTFPPSAFSTPPVLDLAAADPDVLVLVGTQTGNAEVVADAVAERLGTLGFAAHVLDMAEAVPEDLAAYRQIVAVLCTWSEGTYPDNAVDFAEALEAVRPALDGVAFGVVGLGDRDYDPYYQTAALRLRDLLATWARRRPSRSGTSTAARRRPTSPAPRPGPSAAPGRSPRGGAGARGRPARPTAPPPVAGGAEDRGEARARSRRLDPH